MRTTCRSGGLLKINEARGSLWELLHCKRKFKWYWSRQKVVTLPIPLTLTSSTIIFRSSRTKPNSRLYVSSNACSQEDVIEESHYWQVTLRAVTSAVAACEYEISATIEWFTSLEVIVSARLIWFLYSSLRRTEFACTKAIPSHMCLLPMTSSSSWQHPCHHTSGWDTAHIQSGRLWIPAISST